MKDKLGYILPFALVGILVLGLLAFVFTNMDKNYKKEYDEAKEEVNNAYEYDTNYEEDYSSDDSYDYNIEEDVELDDEYIEDTTEDYSYEESKEEPTEVNEIIRQEVNKYDNCTMDYSNGNCNITFTMNNVDSTNMTEDGVFQFLKTVKDANGNCIINLGYELAKAINNEYDKAGFEEVIVNIEIVDMNGIHMWSTSSYV